MTKNLAKLLVMTCAVSGCGSQKIDPQTLKTQQAEAQNASNRASMANGIQGQLYAQPMFLAKKIDGLNRYTFVILLGKTMTLNGAGVQITDVKSVSMALPTGAVVELKKITDGALTFETFRVAALREQDVDAWKQAFDLKDTQISKVKEVSPHLLKIDLLPAKVLPKGKSTLLAVVVLAGGQELALNFDLKLEQDAPYEGNK